jgi:plastocyanin
VATNDVTVSNDFFSPADIKIAVGSTVTWTWDQNAAIHNVTFNDGSGSADLTAGATFKKAFPTAGTFSFHCTIHPSMTGSVLVQ